MKQILSRLRQLKRDRSGVSMVEFAVTLPFFLSAGLWAVELSNYALATMKVSQMAIHLADNASRIGDTSVLINRKIFERDINDVIYGSHLQTGKALDFYNNGRAVISSLQVYDPDNDGVGTQWIMWQRCKGIKNYSSAYGSEDDGRNGSLPGMGPATERVTALPGEAVIYVEVFYEYKPLVSRQMVPGGTLIRSQSAYTVRDRRDITAIYQRNPGAPDPVARCNQRDAFTDPPPT